MRPTPFSPWMDRVCARRARALIESNQTNTKNCQHVIWIWKGITSTEKLETKLWPINFCFWNVTERMKLPTEWFFSHPSQISLLCFFFLLPLHKQQTIFFFRVHAFHTMKFTDSKLCKLLMEREKKDVVWTPCQRCNRKSFFLRALCCCLVNC